MHRFFPPDVAPASIAGFDLVPVVPSVTFTVGEDDEDNKEQFVLIDASGKLTEALKLDCITNNTLPFYYI